MTKTILAFGYIPKGKGGKQETGLATGIFDLHDAINNLNTDYKIIIAATDIHKTEIFIDNTKVIGWNKKMLLKYLIKRPIRFLFFIFKALSMYRFWTILPLFNTIAKLLFLDYAIEKTKPNLIHFHGSTGALLSTGLWNKNKKKILRMHGINGFDSSISGFKINRDLENFVTGLIFEKVTFVANEIVKEWKEVYGKFSCDMIPILNGYNPVLFNPSELHNSVEEKYDLVTFSGVSERKGQIRVIEALLKLKLEGLNISYLIIGSGLKDHLDILYRLIEVSGLDVTFIEYLPQKKLNYYLHQSKYFILPSITEGFGKVYIESIGAGIPVIIPKHLPLAKETEILTEINSFFIEDSSVESITNGLREIFKKEKLYSRLEISNSVKALQWDTIALQYLDIYKSII